MDDAEGVSSMDWGIDDWAIENDQTRSRRWIELGRWSLDVERIDV
jgi:hypothetical protein